MVAALFLVTVKYEDSDRSVEKVEGTSKDERDMRPLFVVLLFSISKESVKSSKRELFLKCNSKKYVMIITGTTLLYQHNCNLLLHITILMPLDSFKIHNETVTRFWMCVCVLRTSIVSC